MVGSIERQALGPPHFRPRSSYNGPNLAPSVRISHSEPKRSLSIKVYKVLSDAVILDWYIALSDKDQMSSCDVSYTRLDNDTESVLLSPFLPATRSLRMLRAQQHGLDFRRDLPGSLAPSYNLGAYVHQLPVSSSSSGISSEGNARKRSHFPFSIDRTSSSSLNKISPHLVLGASCGVVGFIIMTITLALAGRRYSQYRSSQTRLWELQTVRDLEAASYPSFIPVSTNESNQGIHQPTGMVSSSLHYLPNGNSFVLSQEDC
ncbi:unnamed protein product [Lepeophtheirus salmonis]|uniref:(salmon louse) hypothetical protein n=1 Tax=Lepeophtheirus salmonis TaxID=72036 RepID=A0A7R8CVG5_LEPSM|nr:unnamed protein product [Lepeophtheirus salmonis]CAF2911668.1 unnamed protein product [Lepeophtheirus salmonis]